MGKIIRLSHQQQKVLWHLAELDKKRAIVGPSVTAFRTLVRHGFAEGARETCDEVGKHHGTKQVMGRITPAGRAWLDFPAHEQRAVQLLRELAGLWPKSLTLVMGGRPIWEPQVSVMHTRDLRHPVDLEFAKFLAAVNLPFVAGR